MNVTLVLKTRDGETKKVGKLLLFRGKRTLLHFIHHQGLRRTEWGFPADALRYALEQKVSQVVLGTKVDQTEQSYRVPIGFFQAYGDVVDRGKWGSNVLLPAALWEPLFEGAPYAELRERTIEVSDQPWLGDDSILIINTDGGMVGGNPGPIGAGVIIQDSGGNVLETISKPLGYGTNNEAEYGALLVALEEARRRDARQVFLRADSELMIKQVRGEYQVRDPKIKKLHARARELIADLESFDARWVPRESNAAADEAAGVAAQMNAEQGSLL